MRRKTLLNRNVIIVLMLFIFLMTAFISTAYSFWYFPDESSKTVKTDMKVDDIEENFKNKDAYGSYLKIIDCRDGVIPTDADFAKSESGFLDNSENFTDKGNIFIGKNGNYSKKVFGVSSSAVNELYKYPFKGEYALGSFVSSVFYRSGTSITSSDTSVTGSDTSMTGSDTSMTEIYLYDLLNSQYKLVDHLTNESIELRNKNVTSSDGGDMGEPLDAKSYSSTKFEDYRKNIGYPFSKSRILFLVPRNTETPPTVASDYNIYFHNENEDPNDKYNKPGSVWLWNDRTDFGVSLPLSSETKDGKSYKSLHIKYNALYEACNDFNDTNKKAGFIMTPQTAPTGLIFKFKTENETIFAPKDNNGYIEYLALPLPKNSNSFDIYITADKDNRKFTINTNQDVDLTKNKNIVFYSANGLDHLWMWSKSEADAERKVGRWISSNYVYKFKMTGCNEAVSCFSYNYGEKFNFYKKWTGSIVGTSADFSHGFTFDKNEEGEKINYDYDSLILANYKGEIQADADGKEGRDNISGLFDGTSEHTSNYECTSIYLLENDKNNGKNKKVTVYTSRDAFITALNDLN